MPAPSPQRRPASTPSEPNRAVPVPVSRRVSHVLPLVILIVGAGLIFDVSGETLWVGTGAVVVLWTIWEALASRAGARRAVAAAEQRWLELPGARSEAPGTVALPLGPHARRPVRIRLRAEGGRARAILQAPVRETTFALRTWPDGLDRPPMDPEGAPVGGPPVDRAPLLEARYASVMRIDTSDAERAAGLMSGEVAQAMLEARKRASGGYAGTTYDGQTVGVHLDGPVVSDPRHALALAQPVWRAFAGGGREGQDAPTPLSL